MLLLLIIILILIGAAVIGSIYSNFIVFYSGFSESESYHKAYYASISALERAELVTKQRQPGYVGSGGFILGNLSGTYKGGDFSDKSLDNFSYLGDNWNEPSVFWEINSRTTRIPAEGRGDVEGLLAADDSSGYNMMDYENTEVFLLYYDDELLTKNPYKKIGILGLAQSQPSYIEGEIRLPRLLKESGFGTLKTETGLVGNAGDLPTDDGIVDWQIRGGDDTSFKVFSTNSIKFEGSKPKVDYDKDSVFRESDINKGLVFNYGNSRNPFNMETRGRSVQPTVISESENQIKNLKFSGVFLNSKNTQLRFSLLNLLQGNGSNIYPFLEYYVYFGGKTVPDKYWTITAKGGYKDYNVDTIIQKPTVKETIFGSFTSIF